MDQLSRYELGLAAVAGVSGVAGSYAVAGYTRSFVVAPVDALVVNATPGVIVAFMIDNVGELGHLLHLALSFAVVTGLFAAFALAGGRVAERVDSRVAGALPAGALTYAATAAITAGPVLAVGAALPVAVATALGRPQQATPELDRTRRHTLGAVAGALAFVGAAVTTGTLLSRDEQLETVPGSEAARQLLSETEPQRLETAGDLPGLVSDIKNFYNVDIAQFDPEVTDEDWSLTITGELTETETTLTYDELVDRPIENRLVTLRCVGEDLNGKKLDTAVWTGTPIKPLLEEVDPNGECGCVVLRGDDGYFVEFPTEVLETGFLAWGMNGKELPTAHGHPVRILIPGHWGETNVKWLTEMEVLDKEMDGYWEQRGWEGTGTVTTVAKLWDEGITTLDDGRIELAGHAYAGIRGVERVEVSTDGGSTWTDATLSEPLPGDDVWRMWRHRFEPSGSHDVVVRAVDGEGQRQPEERSDSFPRGASGWVRRTVSP
jgi:DMSO/TMAO reductase YedYZ molybdopterin-dependent catalytic subunit